MMAEMCPMGVPGTTVAESEIAGGAGLSFTTTTDVTELRRRVRGMAEMHNQPGHGGMTGGGGMMGGGMMPAASASSEDVAGGARLDFMPTDAAQLQALREHVRMCAHRMAAGECPMSGSATEATGTR